MLLRFFIFVLLTFIFTIVLAVFQQQLQISFEKIVLPQLAPALGFLVAILIFKGIRTPFDIQMNKAIFLKLILVIISPLILFGVGFYICQQMGVVVAITLDFLNVFPSIIAGIIIGAVGEEIGWRSFLQPFLEREYSVSLTSVLVGMVWGLWHIGHYKNGALFMFGFLCFTISASIVIRFILRETNYNLWLSVFFHVAINIGFYLFYKSSLTNANMIIVNAIVWAIPALFILIKSRSMKYIH
jgi:uncharacterized protein